jgi:diguanylate cyclase (GGDEF)-like protein
VLVFSCSAGVSQSVQHAPPPLRTLQSAREVHRLPYEQVVRAFPVHLRAVVTYYDPYIDTRHAALFVHDATGAIFARLPARPILALPSGTLVDLVGVSGPGDYAPIVDKAEVRIVGMSHVPEHAQRATLEQLLAGRMDGQWVEVEGVVHAVHLLPKNVIFDFETNGGPISATTLRENDTDYNALVDSLVRLHGNAAPLFNKRMQMAGVHMYFPTLAEIKVIRAAPKDPFAMPAVSVANLVRYEPAAQLAHRDRVQGIVTLIWPGRTLCIQNGSDGICMQTAQQAGAKVGDLVDVVGFPAISNYKPTLENAIFRVTGPGTSLPASGLVTADQVRQGRDDGQLITIDGELIGQDFAAANPTLMLRAGEFIYTAILPKDAAGPGLLPWKDGSILRLSGICNVQFDSMNTNSGEGGVRPGPVQILLRTADDIAVVSSPSWWTPRHALNVIAVIGIVVLAALAWIMVLRFQVEQRTEALRESKERLRHLSEHDALTDLPNRILLNDRLHVALKRAERSNGCLGLLMVDVDRFKEINDEFGHLVGDRLLCELAQRMCSSVRMTDTVARIGGDEFIVLLPDLRMPIEAETIAAKILAAVSQPFIFGDVRVMVTVSMGVATYPDGGADIESIMQSADAAMYSAKAMGRNGFSTNTRSSTHAETSTFG